MFFRPQLPARNQAQVNPYELAHELPPKYTEKTEDNEVIISISNSSSNKSSVHVLDMLYLIKSMFFSKIQVTFRNYLQNNYMMP